MTQRSLILDYAVDSYKDHKQQVVTCKLHEYNHKHLVVNKVRNCAQPNNCSALFGLNASTSVKTYGKSAFT